MVVHHARTLVIHLLCIRGNDVTADFARDAEHAAVGVHRILEILRRIVVEILLGEAALLQLHDPAHHRMLQLELQILVI